MVVVVFQYLQTSLGALWIQHPEKGASDCSSGKGTAAKCTFVRLLRLKSTALLHFTRELQGKEAIL